MSVRVTPTEVRKIIPTDIEDYQIEVFIETANLVINEYLLGKVNEDLMTKIELWMTAHLIASGPDPREKELRIHDVQVNLEGVSGRGLEFSRYGQQVIILDPTGKLRQAFKPRAVFSVQSEFD
jgi:hypothetical protein